MTPDRRDDPNDEVQIMREVRLILFGLAVFVGVLALGTWIWRLAF